MDEKTMTEWEKLCEELTQSLERQEFMISKSTPHKWRQVKAVGDRMQQDNTRIQKELADERRWRKNNIHQLVKIRGILNGLPDWWKSREVLDGE